MDRTNSLIRRKEKKEKSFEELASEKISLRIRQELGVSNFEVHAITVEKNGGLYFEVTSATYGKISPDFEPLLKIALLEVLRFDESLVDVFTIEHVSPAQWKPQLVRFPLLGTSFAVCGSSPVILSLNPTSAPTPLERGIFGLFRMNRLCIHALLVN
jgi:hypothetical protein